MRDEYLFVYGTLRRDGAGRMHRLLSGDAQLVGEATCRGRLYRIADYPGLVPSTAPEDLVLGEVYVLGRPGLTLSRLDDYEGCGPRFSYPTEFVRRTQDVTLGGGRVLEAWAYLFNRSLSGLFRIESGDFLHQK